MENKDSFQILMVKPDKISHIPWESSQYLDVLFNLAFINLLKVILKSFYLT